MLNVFTKFYKIEKKHHEIMLNTFNTDNLKDRYWNMCSENKRGSRERTGGPESWTVPPPLNYTLTPAAAQHSTVSLFLPVPVPSITTS